MLRVPPPPGTTLEHPWNKRGTRMEHTFAINNADCRNSGCPAIMFGALDSKDTPVPQMDLPDKPLRTMVHHIEL
jgi:hypothetical protein